MTVSYSELVTQIRAYTEVDSSVLSDTIVNDFIEFAENRIFRDVDIDVFKSHQTANLTASNAFLSLPGGSSPTPTSLGTVRLYANICTIWHADKRVSRTKRHKLHE